MLKILILFFSCLVYAYASVAQEVKPIAQEDITRLHKKIESLVWKTGHTYIPKTYELIDVYHSKLVWKVDSTYIITPYYNHERKLFNSSRWLDAQTFILHEDQLLASTNSRSLYRNYIQGDINKRSMAIELIAFIRENNLTSVYRLAGNSLNFYYGQNKLGEKFFFHHTDKIRFVPVSKVPCLF